MRQYLAFLAAAVALSGAAQGAEGQPNPPLVVNGDLSLTTADFEAYLDKVPEKLRADFRKNPERVKPTIDGMWVYRMLAKKARDAGLAGDPVVAARIAQAQDTVLAEAYMRRAEKSWKIPDVTARAREVFSSHPEDYKEPEQVHVQHVLVAVNDCRNSEQALQRAKEIHARVALADSAAFLAEAAKSSDDPSKKTNKGDLGLVPPSSFDPAFAAAVSKMTRPGEVSEPVESRFGYHIVRFVARKPARQKAYDEVKEELIAAERQKLIDAMKAAELSAVRNDPGNHVYTENVEALTKAAKP